MITAPDRVPDDVIVIHPMAHGVMPCRVLSVVLDGECTVFVLAPMQGEVFGRPEFTSRIITKGSSVEWYQENEVPVKYRRLY